jgi:hypothetical protein
MAGEEIIVPHAKGGSSDVRPLSLRKTYGFECGSCGCARHSFELEESDVPRQVIESLDKAI